MNQGNSILFKLPIVACRVADSQATSAMSIRYRSPKRLIQPVIECNRIPGSEVFAVSQGTTTFKPELPFWYSS
jgi:hypothetical protein